METKGIFNLKSSSMSYLALSASFEYLCYGSITITICLIVDQLKTSEPDVYRRQILASKVDPPAVRINIFKVKKGY